METQIQPKQAVYLVYRREPWGEISYIIACFSRQELAETYVGERESRSMYKKGVEYYIKKIYVQDECSSDMCFKTYMETRVVCE